MDPHNLPPELADRPFEIAVRRLADDLRYGLDASPYVGSGVDFVQSRPFVDGDPVKDLDWRVTARTGRFHVKQYESLKTMPVYLLVDTSASMAFSSGPVSKHALATLVAGGLGLSALRRLSPVGLLGAGQRRLHFQPSLSIARVFQWLDDLRRCRFDERTHLADRLDQLSGLLRATSLIVILSDLHDRDAVTAVKRLAQRHDCIAIQVEDPAERGRLRGGMFRGVEAETGRSFVAHGRSRWFRGRTDPPGKTLESAGVDHLLLATDRPFVTPLRHLLAGRGGLARNKR
ncbi:MAG: DUF58 domain-containing protein [Planctomycetota bacterium]|jgi:uncharacterized protein (DUF58 family)